MGKIFASVTPSEKFAWQGGYPLYYAMQIEREVFTFCPTCATEEREKAIRGEQEIKEIQCAANYEDPDLFCDGCSERIESAYVEEHATGEHEKKPDPTCFLCRNSDT